MNDISENDLTQALRDELIIVYARLRQLEKHITHLTRELKEGKCND
jgi:hypothetical protein